MKKYTVREFRKCLKEALDAALEDQEVYVNRDGTFYKVCVALNQERIHASGA